MLTIQVLKNYLWHLPKAMLASAWYGFPAKKLTVIGVTGTKGKTTTVHMIEHILRHAGKFSVARISTIGARIGDEDIDTGLHVTSPDPRELQRLLRLALDRGVTDVVLEVTSNGLDQFRVWGVPFALGVITNIAPDHLDYHGTFERYLDAKLVLSRQSRAVILHHHSQGFAALFERIKKIPGVQYRVIETSTTLPFEINRELAMETASLLTIPQEAARAALATFPGVPGRMEKVYKKDFRVIIDFAHTPESMEAILKETRPMVGKKARLIAVFGCAGERDRGRRRMGAVAARLADFFIITAEDPRGESVESISKQIAHYATNAGAIEVPGTSGRKFRELLKTRFARIPDRQEAINAAIAMAKKGDVVVLLGKGHEKSMAYGRTERPWSEREAVNRALTLRRSTISKRKTQMSNSQLKSKI